MIVLALKLSVIWGALGRKTTMKALRDLSSPPEFLQHAWATGREVSFHLHTGGPALACACHLGELSPSCEPVQGLVVVVVEVGGGEMVMAGKHRIINIFLRNLSASLFMARR